MPKPDLTNRFFDIKQLKDWGILLFPISLSRIDNSQNPTKIIK